MYKDVPLIAVGLLAEGARDFTYWAQRTKWGFISIAKLIDLKDPQEIRDVHLRAPLWGCFQKQNEGSDLLKV